MMKKLFVCALLTGACALTALAQQQPWSKYKVHDMERPAPPVIKPATASTPDQAGKAPSDAIVLFDGTNLNAWTSGGKEPTWKVENGYMEAAKGPIRTKEEFGDCQLHLEWMSPPAKGKSQERGNSGVFLMGRFEIQILDSFENPTYPDGQAASVYGQYPPQVNASLPPGQWQTLDIIFTRPRFAEGKLVEPAYVTILHNGVLVQNHQRIEGPTANKQVAKYGTSFPEKGAIELQFHSNPVRFRNMWLRKIEALDKQQHTGELATPTPAPATKPE